MLKPFLLAVAMTLPGLAEAQNCTSATMFDAMARLEAYYQANEIDLFNIQLQTNALRGAGTLTPDGVWGPASAGVICGALDTYVAINGMNADELITSEEDAAYFTRWMGAMARTSLNPGRFETPD